MQLAAILLGLAALGGATMVVICLRGSPRPPLLLAIGHGVLAAAGLGVLIYYVATTTVPLTAQIAAGIFVLAALGGATLFFGFDLQKKPLPPLFMIGHGAIAVIGYVLLLVSLAG